MANTGRKRKRTAGQERTPEPEVIEQVENRIREAAALCATYGTHVTFLFVGVDPQPITIHTKLLGAKTKQRLERMLATEMFYWFPNENLKVAQMYQYFLYTNKIACLDEADRVELGHDTKDIIATTEFTVLAHAYLFGMELEDEKFTNACIDALIEKVIVEETFPTGLAGEVWPFTEGNDRLRRLIVDLHVLLGQCTGLQPPHEDHAGPPLFLEAVYERERRIARNARGKQAQQENFPWVREPCWHYHDHKFTPICDGNPGPVASAVLTPQTQGRPVQSRGMVPMTPRTPSTPHMPRTPATTRGPSIPRTLPAFRPRRESTPLSSAPSSPVLAPLTIQGSNEPSPCSKTMGTRRGLPVYGWTWQEEVALLKLPSSMDRHEQLRAHNGWLETNGFKFQRYGLAVRQHIGVLQREGANVDTLIRERKTWRDIMASRRT